IYAKRGLGSCQIDVHRLSPNDRRKRRQSRSNVTFAMMLSFGKMGIANLAFLIARLSLAPADYTAQGGGAGALAAKLTAELLQCVNRRHCFRWLPVWWPQLPRRSLCRTSTPTPATRRRLANLSNFHSGKIGEAFCPDYELTLLVDLHEAQLDDGLLAGKLASLLAVGVALLLGHADLIVEAM